MRKLLLLLTLALAFQHCKGTKTVSTKDDGQTVTFTDDFSDLIQPVPEPVYKAKETPSSASTKSGIVVDDTERVNAKLDAIIGHNQTVKWIEGFRLLIYSGNNRRKAEEMRDELSDGLFGAAFMRYEQPNYKIFLGEYFTEFDAQVAHAKIRPFYEESIIVKDKIAINR